MLLFLLMLLFLCINIIFDFSGMEGLGLFWLSGQGENVGVETPSIFTVLHMEKIMKVLEFSTGGLPCKATPHQMFMTTCKIFLM